MQRDAGVPEAGLDGFQALQRARIDVVDGRALQHDVTQVRMVRHGVVDAVLEAPGIREVQALVHAQAHEPRADEHLMPEHVPEVFGARHQPDHRDVRPAGAEQVQRERHGHAGDETRFDAERQRRDERHRDGREVRFRVGPGAPQDSEVDERYHRDDDRRRERGLRQEVQRRRQQQRGEGDPDGRERARRRRPGTRIEVHDGPGEAARHRESAGERGRQVAGTQRDEFLVGFDPLASFRRERLTDRYRFDESDDADEQGRHGEFAPEREVQGRHGQRRQTPGDGARDPDAVRVQVEPPRQRDGDGDGEHGAGLRDHAGESVADTRVHQQRVEPLADPEEEGRGRCPDRERRQVRVRHLAAQ